MNGVAASLAVEHEALMQFLYLAPVGLVQAGMDGEIGMINPVSAQLLMPLSRDGGLSNLFVALQDVAPELRGLCQAFAAPSGLICDGLHVHLHGGKQGGPQILALSVLKLDSARLMAVLSDITVQVQRERQLRRSDAWLNALLTSSNDYALVSLDRAGRIERWHDSIGRVTGHTAALVGSSSQVLAPVPPLAERLREADAQGWSVEQGPRLRADGSSFQGSSIITPLPQGENEQQHQHEREPAYCMVLRDLTGCTGAGPVPAPALLTDPLTGLANRRAFFEAAEAAGKAPAQGGVAMILFDADHFNEVSARYGDAAGDAVLCALAQALRAAFRGADVIARLGGAQLGVLLAGIERDRAAAIAERLRTGVEQEVVEIDGHTLRYTVSAGVAAQAGGTGIDVLMAQAGQALARARAGGGNTVLCQEDADAS